MSSKPQTDNDTASDENSSIAGGPRKSRAKWPLLLVLIVAAGGGYYWFQSGENGPEERPLIAEVVIGDIENTIASSGSLEPRNVVPVGAQVSGQLQRLFVEVGDVVEAGDLLAEIDARVQENRVEASRASIEGLRAQIASRQAALDLARANAERQAQLMAERATSQLEYDSAMNNLANAESNVVQLQRQIEQSLASLRTDETQLEYTRIFAPISGTIVSIEMNEGVTLNASQQVPTVLRIADLSTMTVETQVSEADIGNLRAGMEVYFTTLGGGDRRWGSTLRQILPTPQVEQNVVLYKALFDIDNSDGALLSGMTTQVYFVTSAARNVVTVPLGALTFVDGTGTGTGDREAMVREAMDRGGMAGMSREEMAARVQRAMESGELPAGFPGAGGRGDFAGQAARGNAGRTAARPSPGIAAEPRAATVRVVRDDGSFETREVLIGLTSRVAAEVLRGLSPGERVVAGILQGEAAAAAAASAQRGGQQFGGGGGFPGGGFPGGGMPGGFRGF
jgi:membrane fusion protein, macrolide-specific efflux system